MDSLQQPATIFKIVNITVGALLLAGAIGHFIWHSFSSIIIGIYSTLFSVVLIGLEVYTPQPQHVSLLYKYASFLFSFVGRGVFYILAGVLLLSLNVLLYVCGSIVGFIGLVYIGLEFANMFELPSSMVAPDNNDIESRPVWSAEQEG